MNADGLARWQPAAILFDLDGTLVDTAPDLAGALNRVRADEGLEPVPPAALRPFASQGARGLLREGMQIEPGHPRYEPLRQRFLAHYRGNIACESRLFPGFDAVLQQIENSGRPWGVVTNKPGWLTGPLLAELGLAARCAVAISGDSAARAKPAPDPLLLACARLALAPSRCLYLGDDRRDVEAARACGMPVLIALWGYLSGDEPPERWGADGSLTAPVRLLDHLHASAAC